MLVKEDPGVIHVRLRSLMFKSKWYMACWFISIHNCRKTSPMWCELFTIYLFDSFHSFGIVVRQYALSNSLFFDNTYNLRSYPTSHISYQISYVKKFKSSSDQTIEGPQQVSQNMRSLAALIRWLRKKYYDIYNELSLICRYPNVLFTERTHFMK